MCRILEIFHILLDSIVSALQRCAHCIHPIHSIIYNVECDNYFFHHDVDISIAFIVFTTTASYQIEPSSIWFKIVHANKWISMCTHAVCTILHCQNNSIAMPIWLTTNEFHFRFWMNKKNSPMKRKLMMKMANKKYYRKFVAVPIYCHMQLQRTAYN